MRLIKSVREKFAVKPKRILMLKGHSAGIGDILRSSAAWRALKNAFPEADLHLLLLTREPGYASESLISRHHLLKGFSVVDKRTKGIGGWRVFLCRIMENAGKLRPDLVIDFEPHGLRTSIVSLLLRLKYGIRTVGINEVSLRGLFYSVSSVSSRSFARQRGLEFPLEYTNRDFVSLSALHIERNGIPVELKETEEGKEFRRGFRTRFRLSAGAPVLGVNIGCGTPGAHSKRPDLHLLSRIVGHLQQKYLFRVVLTGADFEKDINAEFAALHMARCPHSVLDLAGKTSLSELTGLIYSCSLFISTDSGPYHMAVAMQVPTLAIFTSENRVHHHRDDWVRCVFLKTGEDAAAAISMAEEILGLRESAETA